MIYCVEDEGTILQSQKQSAEETLFGALSFCGTEGDACIISA